MAQQRLSNGSATAVASVIKKQILEVNNSRSCQKWLEIKKQFSKIFPPVKKENYLCLSLKNINQLMENYQHRDYLRMIIRGLIYHNDYLVSYLKREQKKAENDYIEFSEFIGRTITVVQDLEGEFRRLKDQKKNELEAKKNATNDHEINEEINKLTITEGFSLPLEFYTDGEFKISLGFWDISKMRDAINKAFDFSSNEGEMLDGRPIKYILDKPAFAKEESGKVEYQHPHIFYYNGFDVYQSMFESFKIDSRSRTDVRFMYDKMKKDGMIRKNIRFVDYIEWVNETYQLEVEKISFSNLNDTKRLSIYINASQLFTKEISNI